VDCHLELIPHFRTFTTGVFLVVIVKVLVGMRTSPFTLRFFSLAPLIKSAPTFSRDFTLQLVRMTQIRWIATSGSTGVFPVSLKVMAKVQLLDWLVLWQERTAVSQEEGQTEQSSAAPTTKSPSKSSTNSSVISSNLFCFTSLEPPSTQSVPWTTKFIVCQNQIYTSLTKSGLEVGSIFP
jgi:hypothetical protein